MITCAINNPEIVSLLYKHILSELKTIPEKGTLDYDKYLKSLYEKFSKVSSPEVAAKYLQSVPRLIIHAKTTYYPKIKIDLNALDELSDLFLDEKEGIKNIINSLADVSDLAEKRFNIKDSDKDQLNENPEAPIPVVRYPERFKTLSPFGGTLQSYIKIDPKLKTEKGQLVKVEDFNSELRHIINTFDKIKEAAINFDASEGIVYQGKKLMFNAINLQKFATDDNIMLLDSSTRDEILESRTHLKNKTFKKGVAQVNERVILILSDESGKPIYVDDNGDITTQESGKIVYQFMRTVRKEGNSFTVRDIYNIDDQIISPEEFAKATYDPKIDGTEEEYLKKIKELQYKEMKDLYDIQNNVISYNDMLLPITGISNGVPANLTSTRMYIKDLLKMKGINATDVFNSFDTAATSNNGIEKGSSTINVNGNTYFIQRPFVTEDIAFEIAEVLTNPEIDYETKKKFVTQFIPTSFDKYGTTRKYNIRYDDNNQQIYFNTYESLGYKDQTDIKIYLGNTSLQKVNEDKRNSYKDTIIEYLTKKGSSKYNGKTFMHFNKSSLKGNFRYTRLNPKGSKSFFNDKADYRELIANSEAEVHFINADPGFYNYILSFTTFDTDLGQLISGTNSNVNTSTPVFEAKKQIVERLKNGEPITGRINQFYTKDTQWDLFEENGNKISFYNYYLNGSVRKLEESDKDKVVTLVYVDKMTGADGKEYKDVVQVFLDGEHVGHVAETDFTIDKQDLTFEELLALEKRERGANPVADEASRIIDTAKSQEWRNVVNQPNPTDNYLITSYFENQIQNNRTYTKEFIEGVFDELLLNRGSEKLNDAQIKLIKDKIERQFPENNFAPDNINEEINPQGVQNPSNPNTGVVQIFKTNGEKTDLNDDIFKDVFDRSSIKKEFINPLKIRQSKNWWNSKKMEPLRKLVNFETMANIVNSDVYARFIISGATLAKPDQMGVIEVNEEMGTVFQNLTIYHEAWHVFSQLFLTPQQKLDLYKELQNYTDAKGNKPYANMSFRELEEMLAEDFRNYVKTGKAKQAAPKRNSIFRIILDFLKEFFGKALNKFRKQDIQINSLNSSKAKELFDNLYLGKFNSYSPSIDNRFFYELNRGPAQVTNASKDALSPADGLLVSESIDSYFAFKIDDVTQQKINDERQKVLYEASQRGETEISEEEIQRIVDNKNTKAATLILLKDPKKRAWLYEQAKNDFIEKLVEEKKKLAAIENLKDFNDIKSFEILKKSAVAVMKSDPKKPNSRDKYFFLTSQVTDFQNLIPSTKRGQRVKGEDYKDIIRIVGDYYTHKTIIDSKSKVPVDIILVSRPEDAETQYNNYIKVKAKVYTDFKFINRDTPVIDQQQELIRDNIRILQTTLDNWGDETKGIVKYHMENTDFEVLSKKYELEEELDEEGEVKDEATSSTDEETNNDFKQGKRSLQQMASKETLTVLKTLFKVNSDGSIPKNRLGFPERADFGKVFAIVANTIGGIRNRYDAYDRLVEQAKNFPEIKQLVETKFPNPRTKMNKHTMRLSVQFFQDFGKPQIDYWQLYAYHDPIYTNKINYQVKESDLATDNVLNGWVNGFASAAKSKYVDISAQNIRTLNLENIFNDFKDSKSNDLSKSKQFEFAKAIGINMQNMQEIKDALDKDQVYYGLPYIFEILEGLYRVELNYAEDPKSVSKSALKALNSFKLDPITALRKGIPGEVIGKKGLVTELAQLKRLASLQIKYGYDSSSTAIIRSNQNVGYKEVQWSSGHSKAYALNEAQEMQQLWNDPRYSYMSYLDPKINPHTRHLKIINSLFTDGKKNADKNVSFFAYDGYAYTDLIDESSGNITTELDPLSVFVMHLHTMLLAGRGELPRTSEKKFAFGFKLNGGIDAESFGTITKGSDPNLYIDPKMFLPGGKGDTYAIATYMFGYLQGEFDRIKKFRGPEKEKYLNIKGFNNKVVDAGENLFAGQAFSAFKGILSDDVKKELYKLADEQIDVDLFDYLDGTELRTNIAKDIQKYFNEKTQELKTLYYDKLKFLSPSLLEKMGINAEQINNLVTYQETLNDETLVKSVIKSFFVNDWIHKYETSIIMFGDHAQWNHSKEDWSKRIPGLTSDGIGFLFDEGTVEFMKEFNQNTYAKKLSQAEGKEYDNYVFSEKLNSAVIKDAVRTSIYLNELKDLWQKDYAKSFSPAEAKKRAEKDAESFIDMKESDGFGFLTLDAYRALRFTGRGWDDADEELYQKIVKGESVDAETVQKRFFPVYKLHYFGAVENDIFPVTSMYKFSVMPLVPGVNAIQGSEMEKLHKKMLKQNMQLVTFESGAKGAFLTSDGKADNIFTNDKDKFVNTEINSDGDDTFQFTNNPIYLAGLKEVTVINNYYKNEISIATQTRAITIDNLYENGELKNSNNKEVVDEYNNAIKEYSKLLKEDLLNGLGIELIDGTVVGSLKEFARIIQNELTQRDVPEHLVKLVNTADGKISLDLSLHPESDSIEKLLVSYIQRNLVKQKTKGEPLVQVPSTFTNGIWDGAYKTITDTKEIEKLLGSNTLAFYMVNGETRSEEAKCVVALQGDFKNLLKLKDSDGNEIKTRDRLNALIKDPVWFKENKKSLTMFGPRIPNDAHNTIEALAVWHFLPESFGNNVIVSTEIVAKAGSDFDGDKLFMSMPNIGKDGKYIDEGIENFYEVLEETKQLERDKKLPKERLSSKQLIAIQKKYIQNKYLNASIEILMLPDNAVTLTKPNATYLIDKYAEKLQKFSQGYDRYKNIDGRPSDVDQDGNVVLNPTRAFEEIHNLYVHDANLSLEPSLGILAKNTKSIPMYKAAHAKMPEQYETPYDRISVPQKIRFKHSFTKDKDGKKVISLGAERNSAGENISDITSHSLQGILDRAKKSFPFDLKLVPEAMDVYGYLTKGGVDQDEIFLLLNQPMIAKYLADQKLKDGSIYKSIKGDVTNATLVNDTINTVINSLDKKVLKELSDRINALKLGAVLKGLDPEQEIEYITSAYSEETGKFVNQDPKTSTVKELRERLNAYAKGNPAGLNPERIEVITDSKEVKKLFEKSFGNRLFKGSNLYFAVEAIANKEFKNPNEFSKSELEEVLSDSESKSLKALGMFLHFIELEKQYSDMKDVETSFAPDTSKLSTIQEAYARQKKYSSFFSPSRNIDEEFRNNLFNNSVISSLIFDKLTLDILKPVFEIKTDSEISNFLSAIIADPVLKKQITNVYGTGTDNIADFIREYNNNLINFIFQNYISYYFNSKGEFINIPEEVDKLPVVIDDSIETDVEVLDNKIKVNSRLIEYDFATKSFLDTNTTEFGYAQRGMTTFNRMNNPFQNLPQFYRYVISREILAKKNSVDSLKNNSHFITLLARNNNNIKAAYEDYIAERALLNSFNRSYIMGKTKFSYTEDLLQIISELQDNSALRDRFPILGQLSPLPSKDGFKIVKLNNRRDIKGQAAQEYKRQITQLADPTVKKLDNPNNDPIIASKEQRLTDLFSVFSLMMYYQHGVGKTTTGFTNVLDSSQYVSTMRDASQAFMGNYVRGDVSENVLNIIYNISLSKKKFKNLNSQADRYIHTEYEDLAEEETNNGAGEFVLSFSLEGGTEVPDVEFVPGERLISEIDVDRFKKLFAKLGTKPETFFTEDTKFSKFYNGRKQGMPQSAGWYLNPKTDLYDMIDQEEGSGEVYYKNVDLLTGLQMIKKDEAPTQPTESSKTVKAYRTSGTFSSKVNYAQRGSGLYYALDKPFQELGANDKVEEVNISYNPSKTLDATTEEGQTKFMNIKRLAIEGKSFKSMQESNDAVAEAMISNGYDSLIGWIDQDVKDAGRELVLYTQPTGPVKDGSSESSINADIAEYQKLMEASNGVQPKTFTVGTRTWTLNKFGNYDWSDPTTKQIYMRNIDMETGQPMPEPSLSDPVNPELIQKDLEYINSIRKALELDIKFAELGYDLNDLIKRLVNAKTMKDYNDVQEIFNKLC